MAALSIVFFALSFPALALDKPTGRALLTVRGDISHANAGSEAQFDRNMLFALPQYTIRTQTPWTDDLTAFEGPLLRDVLQAAGVRVDEGTLRAIAHNDYAVELPLRDAFDHDVILAMRKDGAVLTLRERGPLWIIYPWSDKPKLQIQEVYARSVWQLKALAIEPNN